MYQDVFLDMTESDSNGFLDDDIEIRNSPTELKLKVNRPFVYMIKFDHELLALGRITVSPSGYYIYRISNPILVHVGSTLVQILPFQQARICHA